MKKFFKGILRMLWKHKILTIICFLAMCVILVMSYVMFGMFVGNGGKYGNRLEGIEKVSITSDDKREVVSFLEGKEQVTKASVRIQGKIIYINILFVKDTTVDKAKAIATETLALLDDKWKSYYDVGYFLKEETDEAPFIITGSKNANLDSISWIKS